MIAILCTDDKGGMLFHRRRQSQDRCLRADLLREVNGRPLWMNSYSAGQFNPLPENVRITEDIQVPAKEFCFVETCDLTPWRDALEGLILYRWNRVYPADLYLTLPLESFTLVRQEEFAGSSHPKITKEVYTR